MNEEQQHKSADRGKAIGEVVEASTRLPAFRILSGGKTQRSAINHQSILTRMIFTVVFFCPYLLDSLVNCASVEIGSQVSPITSHFTSSSNNVSNLNLRSSPNRSHNVPLENHPKGGTRHMQRRQASTTSEWIFSPLVQQADSSSTLGGQQQANRAQIRRANSGLTSRSIPMVSYTNYYRNHNIYSQNPQRVDEADVKLQNQRKYNGILSPTPVESGDSNAGQYSPAAAEYQNVGLNRRRASSLTNELNRTPFAAAVSSKMPEVLTEPETGTTGVSRTAPATDPSLLATERPTSTQEMQMSNDDFSTVVDEIQLGSRAEIGRGSGGQKRARDMDDATMSFYFGSNAPIVFPGTSPSSRGTLRPDKSLSKIQAEPLEMGTFDPFQSKIIDGWKRLYELRTKSQSFDGKKSGISSDQSADAKIITLLTIRGTPSCADKHGYCDDIDTYPRSFFNQVLNKTLSPEIFKDIFGETTDNNSIVTDVEFKLRHDFEDTPLCSVREHTIFPKAAQNRKGRYQYIVNHDDYLQGIRVETCQKENNDCMFTEGHLPGYSSTCKQKYIYKKLLAFTPEGKAMPDSFRLPSCCVCHVRSMYISDRINPVSGIGNSDLQPTIAADDTSWNPSSTTLTYPHHDDASLSTLSSSSSPVPPSTESDIGSITFPTTSKNDLPTYQVPSPTTSTSSSQPLAHQYPGGQQQNTRAENQTASRRLH